ncbi:hypothetical protein KP509_10G016600 [Ceratopteris richardii]|uniref:Uncharacterized protein n=1 Tax=Ceratopteris richardii TaxID=49495 RepID=A0A8T2TYQ3_CERRI|nr:hypothetical protein KP509_10G016600 [Ceratopteris richardii]
MARTKKTARNSLQSQHGNSKVAAKLLKMHIDQNILGIPSLKEEKSKVLGKQVLQP